MVVLPAVILFCVGATTDIRLPGPYMDAVNPDYIAVLLLHPGAQFVPWTLPGMMLFGRLPLLVQLYHGALPLYLGLPAYALFGTGIVGIRIANLTFGLMVLLASAAILRAFRVAPVTAGLCLAALALDPGFLFSFRTQFAITLLPLSLVLVAIALVEGRRGVVGPRVALLAGALCGAACYGYFIDLFLAPAALAHLWSCSRGSGRLPRATLGWLAGFALGALPYPLAMLLILARAGSLHGFAVTLGRDLYGLGIGSSTLPPTGRLAYLCQMVLWTVRDVGPPSMMVHRSWPPAIGLLKSLLLLALPALACADELVRQRRLGGLGVLLLLVLGLAGLFLMFGSRLWLHHAAPLLPLLYLALALSLDRLLSWARSRRRPVRLAGAALVVLATLPLIGGNLVDQAGVRAELRRTGGVGLSSDAITRFAEDSRRDPVPTRAFMPDWGLFMPFVMITRGRIPTMDSFRPDTARQALCRGRDVLLGLVDAPGPDRLAAWTRAMDWPAPILTSYRQRDGVAVIEAVRWRTGDRPVDACRS